MRYLKHGIFQHKLHNGEIFDIDWNLLENWIISSGGDNLLKVF